MPKVTVSDNKGLVQSPGAGVTVESVLKSTNTAGHRDSRSFRHEAGGVSRTNLSDGLALTVNTHYQSVVSSDQAVTLPSSGAGSAGDWITVVYGAIITAGQTHSYTVTDDTSWAISSTLLRWRTGAANAIDISEAGDNVVTIEGKANSDGGIGTSLKFVNTTGAADGWAVEVEVHGQGNQSGAKDAATVFS